MDETEKIDPLQDQKLRQIWDEKEVKEAKKKTDILSFIKRKIDEISSNLRDNKDGKHNGSIGIKLGRIYQAVLYEQEKQQKENK